MGCLLLSQEKMLARALARSSLLKLHRDEQRRLIEEGANLLSFRGRTSAIKDARGGKQKGEQVMLVLTRKKTETIRIGEDIVVTVVQTGRGRVKLGIEAPAHMRVLRGELDVLEPAMSGLLGENFRRNVGLPWELVHEFGNSCNN